MRTIPSCVALAFVVCASGCPTDDTTNTDEVGATATETSESTSESSTSDTSTSDTSTSDTSTSDTSTSDTAPDPFCGDGNLDPGEACDDGNDIDTDACTSACVLATCGDAIVQVGVEACDDGNLDEGDGCSASCLLESCGDGIVQPMEACDDGNMIDSDECTNLCLAAICGDLIVHEGVETCDDGNVVDADECTNACALATCGDAIVYEGVEACDDGNLDDSDGCLSACTIATCGDGAIQAGVDECDDGNVDPGDGCAANCAWEQRFVFVTSTVQYGTMGGLAGADAICNELASDAGLPGTYKAWLSTGQANGTPATRFVQSAVPYVKPNGVKVADNWADLTDGSLDAAINVTETAAAPPAGNPTCGSNSVWSNTRADGTLYNSINSCANWNSTASAGHWGQSSLVNGGWTSACAGGTCSWQEPMYCFQQ